MTTATAYDAIRLALGKIGRGTPGDALSPEDIADGLFNANILLDSWSNEGLLIYGPVDVTATLAPGTSSISIGPGGTIAMARPIEIDSTYIVVAGISYPIMQITNEQYADIPLKNLQATWPMYYNYQNTMPNATLKLYPVVNSTCTFNFKANLALTNFATQADVVNFPPGYFRAFTMNLACELADYYGMTASPRTTQQAMSSKSLIKRNNYQPPIMSAVVLQSEKSTTPYAYIVGGLF